MFPALVFSTFLQLPVLATATAPPASDYYRRSTASSSGCGIKGSIELGKRLNVTLSPSNRTYMYWLPPSYSYTMPTPLILSFHGAGRTSDWQANLDRLTDPAFNRDHILVYPQAKSFGVDVDGDPALYWQGAPGVEVDDVAYTLDILDKLEKELCLDLDRVYATGKSQGGGFTGVLACDESASRRIAAFAPVAGAFYTNISESGCKDPSKVKIDCHPRRCRIPVLDFHGGNDTTISISGGERKGGCLPDVRYWVDEWAKRDGLDWEVAQTSRLATTTNATIYKFGFGDEEGLVTFVYVGSRVNHDWPATFDNTDNEAHGSGPASFNASSMIMEFFGRYKLAGKGDRDNCTSASFNSSLPTSTPLGYSSFTIPTALVSLTATPGILASTSSISSVGTVKESTSTPTRASSTAVQTGAAASVSGTFRQDQFAVHLFLTCYIGLLLVSFQVLM